MYQKLKLAGSVVLIALIFAGCTTTKVAREIPTYLQGQEVNLEDNLKFKVEEA